MNEGQRKKQEPYIPFIWDGPNLNLGRFGPVQRGELIYLTDAEAAYVAQEEDSRYIQAARAVQVALENGAADKIGRSVVVAVEKFLGTTLTPGSVIPVTTGNPPESPESSPAVPAEVEELKERLVEAAAPAPAPETPVAPAPAPQPAPSPKTTRRGRNAGDGQP